jgi:hypothetical protein
LEEREEGEEEEREQEEVAEARQHTKKRWFEIILLVVKVEKIPAKEEKVAQPTNVSYPAPSFS